MEFTAFHHSENYFASYWETHATPTVNTRLQATINQQLVQNCDLLIGVFWTKIGSNTGVAVSGTAGEITKFVAAKKPAMLYFSNRPINPNLINLQQNRKLRGFQDEIYKSALVGRFSTLDELKQNLVRDLSRQIDKMRVDRRNLSRDRIDQVARLTDLMILHKQHQITPEEVSEYRSILELARYSNKSAIDDETVVTGLFFDYVSEVSATIDKKREGEWACCVEICGENYETRKFEVVSIAVNQGFSTASSAIKYGKSILSCLTLNAWIPVLRNFICNPSEVITSKLSYPDRVLALSRTGLRLNQI